MPHIKNILARIKSAPKTRRIQYTLDEVQQIEHLFTRTEELLQRCQAQVGMVTGQEIGEHLAMLNDESFNEKIYNYERLPEGQ